MPYFGDRVLETTTTTGTGTLTLSGSAPNGYQSFAAGIGAGSRTINYVIEGGAEWEVGIGVFDGSTSLTRVTVLESSNAGSLVNFSSGTKTVFSTIPSSQLLGSAIGIQLATRWGWTSL